MKQQTIQDPYSNLICGWMQLKAEQKSMKSCLSCFLFPSRCLRTRFNRVTVASSTPLIALWATGRDLMCPVSCLKSFFSTIRSTFRRIWYVFIHLKTAGMWYLRQSFHNMTYFEVKQVIVWDYTLEECCLSLEDLWVGCAYWPAVCRPHLKKSRKKIISF